jgi:Ankyrin repeats (3 copies)
VSFGTNTATIRHDWLFTPYRAHYACLHPNRCLYLSGKVTVLMPAPAEKRSQIRMDPDRLVLALALFMKHGFAEESEKFRVGSCCKAFYTDRDLWEPIVLSKRGRHDRTVLMAASQKGDVERVRWLLAVGACPHAKSRIGWSALTYASFEGHRTIVDALIEAKAHVDSTANDLTTSLHWACYTRRRAVVQNLLESGANPNRTDRQGGKTSLHYCCRNSCEEILAMLIASGASVNAKTLKGETPLMIAAQQGHMPSVRLLLSHGANVLAAADNGASALDYCLERHHTAVARELLQHGATVNWRSTYTWKWLVSEAAHEVHQGAVFLANYVLSVGRMPFESFPLSLKRACWLWQGETLKRAENVVEPRHRLLWQFLSEEVVLLAFGYNDGIVDCSTADDVKTKKLALLRDDAWRRRRHLAILMNAKSKKTDSSD